MSKRPALGVLTNNASSSGLASNFGFKTAATSASSINVFKSTASANYNFIIDQLNNENEPPQFSSFQTKAKQEKVALADLDFEIFQEEKSKHYNLPDSQPDDDEEDQEDEEEEEEDEQEDEEEDEDDNLEKENEDGLEEEGISRLNLAAFVETNSAKLIDTSCNTSSELMMVMDASISTHNDSSSPMILDDTIKFLSKIEDIDEYDEDEDDEDAENDVDEDEETKRKFECQERENVLMNCLDYKDDILQYMRQIEQEQRPKANYMKKQADISASMRSILIDWLVEVCDEYKLNVETLYLAVNYTDRFLSQMSVLRGKLQLVGTAAMYIASKYEEITPPDVSEFVYITDDTYTKKQVLRMEHLMLKVLDFRMSPPTANWFLSHFLRFIRIQTSLGNANHIDLCQRIDSLSRFLAELTLIDSDTFLVYLPSQIAASAVYLAMYTLGKSWTRQIADICGYNHDLSELKACINDMFKAMQQAASHPQQAIQEKYKQSRNDYVALIEPPKSLPLFLQQ